MYNNFEISLVVFISNITTNHAITYTNTYFPERENTLLIFFEPLPCSSHTAAVLSKEQDASTWPNSGWAQVTFHTEPECVWTMAKKSIHMKCTSHNTCLVHVIDILEIIVPI